MRKWRLLGLALCLAGALAIGHFATAGRGPAEADEPKPRADEAKAKADEAKADEKPAPGKGQRAREFVAAFEKGDAKAIAAFWVEDAEYVDQVGNEFKGREAIEKLYAKLFATQKGAKLTINVTSHKQLAPDVALEEGLTEVTPADGLATTARFSAVLVKKDGEWYFQSVHETIARPPSNAQHFEELEWLIGEWKGGGAKGQGMRVSYDWADDRNFIVSSFAATVHDVPVVGGTQWIAWDAIDKRVRSWTFYSMGGFGEATWSRDGGQWAIKTTARSADGKKLSATNVLTKVDDDHANWQITKLTVDDKPVDDPPLMKLERVKPQPPPQQ